MTNFYDEANKLQDELVAWRRDFHMHPELGYQEHRTAGIVATHLEGLGYRVQTGVAKTGVIGTLAGSRPGPVVMLRFDMDALPVTEETGAEYASQVPGLMHACGHDGHIAIGMGLAQLLADQQKEMAGSVKLIFQPAEEGGNGADLMVKEGALEDPRPDVFLALHLWADKPVGQLDVTPGPVMASAEQWACTITGKGGHGAQPHQAIDPIVASAQVITALQTIISRNVSPSDTAVMTVGTLHGGDAFNIIPSQVEMTGTIRTYNPETREMVLQRLQQVAKGIAKACGAAAELKFAPHTPAVVNDPQVVEIVRRAAEKVLGKENVTSGERTMGSEDASFFMQEIPGCYCFLGAANPNKDITAAHHNPRFDIDEKSLVLGVAVLAQAAASYLL